MDNNVLTALVLAALDDSAIKALNERVNRIAELGFKPQIVTELPAKGNDHTLYLVLQSAPGEDPWYHEYLWLNNEWEKIGTTSIDFENYYTKTEADGKFVQQLVGTSQQGGAINNMGEDGILIGVTSEDLGSSLDLYADHAEMHAGDTSLEMDGVEGTITLNAPNGVKTLSTPVEDDDISTKGYVDTGISNLEQEISGELSDLEQALSDEVSAREQAIQDEADARASDVTALQESIDELSGTLDDDIQELKDLIDTKADEDRFFDGRSEDWDEKTTEEKENIWLGMVEDYIQLDIAETYNINSVLGLDPQETIVSDLYEDEAIDLTNQIIGGSF